jgi:peptidoglycan/LPS O-acetylase OafA/YrhL
VNKISDEQFDFAAPNILQHPIGSKLTRYEPAFDGLRALAVTTVVAYHVSPTLLPGGWMGVDIFFVLSGFLITSLLSSEIAYSGRIGFKKFYMRRMLRLTPAFWTLLAFIIVVAALSKSHRAPNLYAALISGLYFMNWDRAFNLFPQGLLGHTWSLAMEEQFYLLWPAALLFIARRKPIPWVVATIVAMTCWRIYLAFAGAGLDRIYNGFDTHGDALLIGCALALLPLSGQTSARAGALVAIPIAGVMLMLAMAINRSLFTQTIGLTFASLFSAWLIIAASQSGWLRQILSAQPLVYTGRISYGWYLWHYPIMILGYAFLPSEWGKVAFVVLAYLVAACSYQFIERPFLRLKLHFEPKTKPLTHMNEAPLGGISPKPVT